eukprot:scaffold461_cov321-Pavlova_lutheri.AAC.2
MWRGHSKPVVVGGGKRQGCRSTDGFACKGAQSDRSTLSRTAWLLQRVDRGLAAVGRSFNEQVCHLDGP